MLCYVGKATKIFFAVVAALAVTGLVVGLVVFHRGLQRAPHKCEGSSCGAAGFPPIYSDPMPAAAASSASPPRVSASANGTVESTAPPSFLTPPSPPANPDISVTPPAPATPIPATVPPVPAPPPIPAAAEPPVLAPPTTSAAPPTAPSPPGAGVAAAQGPRPFLAHNSSSG